MQGRDAVWFVGAPASFDSVEAVFDYNRLILGNLEREAAGRRFNRKYLRLEFRLEKRIEIPF